MLLFDARPPQGAGPPARRQRPRLRLAAARRVCGSAPVAALGRPVGRQPRGGGRAVPPPAVDVSSGVEGRPGQKDPARIRRFLELARGLAVPEPADRTTASSSSRMTLPNTYRGGPDARGRFGIYGGRFVAETLMPLILELEQRLRGGQGRSGLSGRARRLARRLRRPAEPAVPRRAAHRPARRRARLLQARRAQPHRRAQDQQHHRPDPARPAHGQAPHHRRDRRRPARRRDRDRGGALRPAVRRLHGRARHRAAAAERVPHEAARRRGARRDVRLGDAQGRDERGAARLGHQRRRHLLHHRHASPARIPIPRWCATSSA